MKDIPNELTNKLIFGKYKIIKEEKGNGISSKVFLAKNIMDQEFVTLKIQEKTQILGDLEKEAYYLFQLKGIGIPKVISYGHSGKYKILVEELLGKSLEQLFKENRKEPIIKRLKDMLLAGLQIIDRIKFIHSYYILHLDINPDNFSVGKMDNSLIYIIDFGNAKKYRSSRTGKHVKFSKNSFFLGNLKYSSVNTMKGIIPSRRDDLESIGYMLIYLFKQELPWDKINTKNLAEFVQKIYEIKNFIPIKMLCEGLPKEMMEFMKYIKILKFEEEPKYDYLTKILETMLERIDANKDFNFSRINQTLTSNRPRSPLIRFFNNRRKISPFSRIINSNQSAKSNNYTALTILEKDNSPEERIKNKILKNENKYLFNIKCCANKNKNLTIRNKRSFSTECSVDKNLKFKTTNKKEIINQPKRRIIKNNIIQKSKLAKLNIYNNNFPNEKKTTSRNVITFNNNILNKQLNYQSIINNKKRNYNILKERIIPRKRINILINNSTKLNPNINKRHISSNNSKIKLNTINTLTNKYYNNDDNQNYFLNHYNTKNNIRPLKYNDLLYISNEENNIEINNDIINNKY